MKERGFVLHRPAGSWEHALAVEGEDIAVAMSRDILDALVAGRGPRDVLVALGYAGGVRDSSSTRCCRTRG